MCVNGRCVSLASLCNRRDDCGDASDERNCHVNECLNRRVSGCTQDCENLPVGYKCKCWPGFRLKNDGQTCVDIDECSSDFPCSQLCVNTYGSYKCLCADGYEAPAKNSHSCRSLSAEEPFLILADHHDIRKISTDGSNYTPLKQGLSNIIAVDFDYRKELIYWIDSSSPALTQRRINRMRLNGSDLKVIHRTSTPSALAVDWIGKNLYWCDIRKKSLEVSKANGLYPVVLVSTGLDIPTDLALDADTGHVQLSIFSICLYTVLLSVTVPSGENESRTRFSYVCSRETTDCQKKSQLISLLLCKCTYAVLFLRQPTFCSGS
ncbi:unnamed protein product [Oncorhynchus mykiss]|uniref:EGF-like domain-containing protein n=1 Tax=Oncorhynchus mykiss TaxID=8022 RepID=A0A060YMH7_ONCMY|nr:unnamed protein product [Oncorhynchus mykiss]